MATHHILAKAILKTVKIREASYDNQAAMQAHTDAIDHGALTFYLCNIFA